MVPFSPPRIDRRIIEEVNDTLRSPLYLSLLLFSFSLPFGGALNSVFLISTLAFFLWGCFKKEYSFTTFLPFPLLVSCIFYLLWVAGCFYSVDKVNAVTELQLKSSLFIFPVIFFYAYKKIDTGKILLAFVAGCLVASVICLLRACVLFLYDHNTDDFTYATLSWFMHTGYFGMYLVFASLIVFLWNKELAAAQNEKVKFYITVIISLFLYLVIVLLSTRTNLIVLLITFVILGFSYVFQKKYLREGLILVGGLVVIIIALFIIFHSGQDYRLNRFNNVFTEKKIDSTTDESVDVRILIWHAAATIIKKNPILGVGTGDAKSTLVNEYKVERLKGAEAKTLNAHNEFIQTCVTIGFAGLLLLVVTLFAGLPIGIKHRHILLPCFILLVAINFFTESMLERQAGVVFFAFFNSLLITRELKQRVTSPNN